ncbi:Sjogrens syndrome scleroderma autoantigen 1 [Ferroglobus placidus DSM 10642]|uniref:Sjogrens syndrome scleroderma autoantigen 1 n=1 Tax=Ferroglobus placidus (strain DSM 10642 / AEDII12DO) TaxID=589924 RepID=D3RYL7_FERPA|nr:Sjogren's syndrome/scleroderma autoantigen 1 family protein [Ferroglobus placidus]ADC65580.1 Sjogrens syndrome scleroderma autoantigen 1 [Ferroglobus placidus DSM 10642]
MEDKKISEAAELLYKGAKMLQFHCQDCGLPLFKHEGKTFCPGCKVEYEIVENHVKKIGEIKEETEKVVEKIAEEVPTKARFNANFDYVEENLTEVMKKLSEKLVKADSLREMEEIISILNEIVELSERLKKLRSS